MESHSKTMGKPWVFAGYMGMWISLGRYENFILDRSLSRLSDRFSEKRSLFVPELIECAISGVERKRQMACKPGSVHHPKAVGWPFIWDARYRTPRATDPGGDAEMRLAGEPAHRPYLVLLLVGFTMPLPLPAARCALTAPFHPYPRHARAVCSLWHFPWGRPRRTLSGTIFPWSPDFPPRSYPRSGHPAIWRGGTLMRHGVRSNLK